MLFSKYFPLFITPMLALVLTSCTSKQEPISFGQKLNIDLITPKIRPDSFFYSAEEAIAITLANEHGVLIGDSPENITYLTLDGKTQLIQLERLFKCDYAVYYNAFVRLSDGRLALRGYCTQVAPQQAASYLLAYDFTEQTTSLLIASPLPIDDSGSFAWNPSNSQAMISFGHLLSGLYWIDRKGFAQPVTGTIQVDNKSFSLETAFTKFNRDGFTETGNATAPNWSPDGATIAFFASSDAINRQSWDRVQGRWALFLMDTQRLDAKSVLTNVYNIGKPRWSPDSRFIALTGQVGHSQPSGLWVYTLVDDKIQFIAEGVFKDFIWAAEGTALYGLRYKDNSVNEIEVWHYDLQGLLQTATP